MLILALDSSSQSQSLAVFDDIKQRFVIQAQRQSQSSQLMSLLVESFQGANLQAQDIGLLACSVGPGSFTGIRSTITIVKTLAAELNLKIYTVNNFQLARFKNQLSESDPVAIAAGKNDYFISLDVDYLNPKTNFFSMKSDGYKVYELQESNIASSIINMMNGPTISHKELQPYYLREPSINVKVR